VGDYDFPRIFVEGYNEGPFCCASSSCYSITETRSDGCYGVAIYESVFKKVIDSVKGIVARSYCIEVPWRREALMVKQGTHVVLIEVTASQVVLTVREGDTVEKGMIIAHTVTGKGESRSLRAPSPGILVYVGVTSFSNPESYVLVLAGEEDVVTLRRC